MGLVSSECFNSDFFVTSEGKEFEVDNILDEVEIVKSNIQIHLDETEKSQTDYSERKNL